MPRGVYKRTKPAWNKGLPRTEEAKRKQKETTLLKYGVSNVSQAPEVKNKISISHSTDEWKDKVKQTKEIRYGDPNNYYKNIIYVWTISDPKKQQTASKNKLNYIMLYSKRDIEEAIKNNLL